MHAIRSSSNPEMFLWRRDEDAVVAVTPGLYELGVGVFTGRCAALQLLLNGEPALSSEGAVDANASLEIQTATCVLLAGSGRGRKRRAGRPGVQTGEPVGVRARDYS